MYSRYVRRAQWEAKLRRRGCVPLEGKGPLNTAEWWRAPSGPPFTVPIEPDGRCEYWALQKLCEQFGLEPPNRDD